MSSRRSGGSAAPSTPPAPSTPSPAVIEAALTDESGLKELARLSANQLRRYLDLRNVDYRAVGLGGGAPLASFGELGEGALASPTASAAASPSTPVTSASALAQGPAAPLRCADEGCRAVLPPESLSRCGGCKAVAYCGRTCQERDWPRHKQPCKEEQARLAAVARDSAPALSWGGGRLQQEKAIDRWEMEPITDVRRAAERGDAAAQCILGSRLMAGEAGARQNHEQAFFWLRKSVDQGFARAQSLLGIMMGSGIASVRKDDKEAMRLFRLGAAQLDPLARIAVADGYETGKGVEKDVDHAIKLYREAAADGIEGAKDALRRLNVTR